MGKIDRLPLYNSLRDMTPSVTVVDGASSGDDSIYACVTAWQPESILIFPLRRQAVDGQAVRDVVDHGIVERRAFGQAGVESEGAALAGVDVVLAHEMSLLGELHDFARMQRIAVHRIAVGRQ
jgi:hypothetical protein